jgi:hypothetical protein
MCISSQVLGKEKQKQIIYKEFRYFLQYLLPQKYLIYCSLILIKTLISIWYLGQEQWNSTYVY